MYDAKSIRKTRIYFLNFQSDVTSLPQGVQYPAQEHSSALWGEGAAAHSHIYHILEWLSPKANIRNDSTALLSESMGGRKKKKNIFRNCVATGSYNTWALIDVMYIYTYIVKCVPSHSKKKAQSDLNFTLLMRYNNECRHMIGWMWCRKTMM